MTPDFTTPSPDLPVYEEEVDIGYSIEVIAELAGVHTQTILHYQEQGFIRPSSREPGDQAVFDVECLRQIRRIGHLRETCEMNDAGLKLILDLLHQIELLREEQRQMRR